MHSDSIEGSDLNQTMNGLNLYALDFALQGNARHHPLSSLKVLFLETLVETLNSEPVSMEKFVEENDFHSLFL